MKLLDIVTAFEARISGGCEFLWECYGRNARYLDFQDRDGLECGTVIFDTKDQTVYQVDLYVPGQDQAFRWINPDFVKDYTDECVQRKVDPDSAWDNVQFVNIDKDTAIQYASDIAGTYYDNLPVPA